MAGFVDTPITGATRQVYDFTGIERTAEGVDKEQFEPAAYGDDTWNHTIQYGYHYEE